MVWVLFDMLNICIIIFKKMFSIFILMVLFITKVIEPLLVLTTWEGEPTSRKSFLIKEKQEYVQAIDNAIV